MGNFHITKGDGVDWLDKAVHKVEMRIELDGFESHQGNFKPLGLDQK